MSAPLQNNVALASALLYYKDRNEEHLGDVAASSLFWGSIFAVGMPAISTVKSIYDNTKGTGKLWEGIKATKQGIVDKSGEYKKILENTGWKNSGFFTPNAKGIEALKEIESELNSTKAARAQAIATGAHNNPTPEVKKLFDDALKLTEAEEKIKNSLKSVDGKVIAEGRKAAKTAKGAEGATKETIREAAKEAIKKTREDAAKKAGETIETVQNELKGIKEAAKVDAAPKGFFSKSWNFMSGKWDKFKTGTNNLLGYIPGYKTLAKGPLGKAFAKTGGAGMMVIEGIIDIVTEVGPAFVNDGPLKGFKQLGKSFAKVGASAVGWSLGAAGGAKIGAAIGSCFGPVGMAIGAVAGTIGGMVGSAVAVHLAKGVMGESASKEREIAQQAQQAAQDPKAMQKIISAASEKANEELASGEASKEAIQIAALLQNKVKSATQGFGNLVPNFQAPGFNGQTQYAISPDRFAVPGYKSAQPAA